MENSSSIIYYRDDTGNYAPIANKYGYLNVISTQFTTAVATGIFPGKSVFTKSGYNGTVTGTEEDIISIGGVYVQPTVQMQMEVVSSSVSDTSAGIGVKSIRIFYLDSTFTEKTTDVTLNGITPVATSVSDIFRINGVKALTVGSNGSAVGDIDIRNLADTPIYSRIDADHIRDRLLIYTVPKNKNLFISSLLVACGSQTTGRHVEFTPKATFDPALGVLSYYQDYPEVLLQDSAITLNFDFPVKFPTGTEIKVGAFSPDGSTTCSATARGWLEDTI